MARLHTLIPLLIACAPFIELGGAQPRQDEAAQPNAPDAARAWDHATSDIAVDPRLHFGHLDNGMRFAWAHNPEPWHRVYVRLHVDVGSLAETESERGMAHFLEHMAFNGSEHFEAGTLIDWFQRNGMSFGADTNAHTSFSETVYKLDLPKRDEETLRDGLLVLRDFAGGLLLSQEEIDAEKGVIDGEERERDSAGFRTFVRLMERQYAGTRFPVRVPIGTKAARDAFSAQSVRAFYERWYRPENMTLVIVGDLRDFNPEGLIHELFDDMTAPEESVAGEPALGKPTSEALKFNLYEEEIPGLQLFVAQLKPYVDRPDTAAERQANLPRAFAHRMLDLRFREAIKRPETAYLSAQVADAGGFKIFEGGELTVMCQPDKWEAAMVEAVTELRKALQFGFQESELNEVRADFLRSLDEAVARESKADSRQLLAVLLDVIENGGVASNAMTAREILAEAARTMTPKDCNDALGANWNEGETSLVAIGNQEFENADEQLSAVYEAASKIELKRPGTIESAAFAYSSDPEAASDVLERAVIEDLGITQVTLANGVRLNVKPTDFKEKQVLVRICAGSGAIDLTTEQLTASELFGAVYVGGGLGKHSADDIRRLTAGRQAGVNLNVEEDRFVMNAATTAEDLLLQFELACAYLTDPGFRPDMLNVIRPQLPLMFEEYAHSPTGPLRLEFLPQVLQGDPRARVLDLSPTPTLAQMQAIDMKAIEAASTKLLENPPIEITIVGDIDVETVVSLAQQSFGALPERRPAKTLEELRGEAHVASGISVISEIETADAKSTLFMLFPTDDGFDDERRRNIFFLGRVVDDRLRLEVRERLGAAYSPMAAAQASRLFKGLGAVMIQAVGDPEQSEQLIEACKHVASNLAENGITQEEVDRIGEPILNMLRDLQRQNSYWLDGIDRAQSDPTSLESVRTILATYDQLDAETLSKLAAKYMSPERCSTLLVQPKQN
ncbi:MAG: zinc protease [Planctomycetota bacterium]|jgi:zinc protease